MPSVTVVIAHRKKASRARCLRLLRHEQGIRVVGEARTLIEVIAAAKRKPRILLLDLSLSKGDGVELLPILRQDSPRTRVILLTDRTSEARILDALSQGVRGYLEKKFLRTFLPKAVRLVDAGGAWVPRKLVAKILNRLVRLTTRGMD